MKPEICLVAGLRSGTVTFMGGSFFSQEAGIGAIRQEGDLRGFGIAPGGRPPIPGRFQIGSGGLATHPGLLPAAC